MDGVRELVSLLAKSLQKIITALDDMDRKSRVSPNLKEKLSQNYDRWVDIAQEFRNLVLRSADVAREGLDTAKEFTTKLSPMLTDESYSKRSRKEQVGNFLEVIDRRRQGAQDMSQGFVDLKKKMERLANEFKDMLSQAELSIPTPKRHIQNIEIEIKTLKDVLSRLENQIERLDEKRTDAKAAAGAAGTFGFVVPVAWIGAVAASVKVSNLTDEIEYLEYQRWSTGNDLLTKEAERDGFRWDAEAIPGLISSASKCSPDMQKIISIIGTCTTAWASVRACSQDIKEKLDYVQGTETERLFRERVKTTERKCDFLGNSLAEYIKSITQDQELQGTLRSFEINHIRLNYPEMLLDLSSDTLPEGSVPSPISPRSITSHRHGRIPSAARKVDNDLASIGSSVSARSDYGLNDRATSSRSLANGPYTPGARSVSHQHDYSTSSHPNYGPNVRTASSGKPRQTTYTSIPGVGVLDIPYGLDLHLGPIEVTTLANQRVQGPKDWTTPWNQSPAVGVSAANYSTSRYRTQDSNARVPSHTLLPGHETFAPTFNTSCGRY